ncbi:hypothetical protein FK216_10495 [Moraxellaceae bacterium AER2_44_116]|nr:hypothetical protein [Moraxellaceae bacterium]TQC97069.1 hypothetical protein FK216_10495 [Moraxellaceae bacterium AER2_44_116]
MQRLDDQELQGEIGQAGADFSLRLSLNHRSDYTFDTTVCSDLVYCRLGMSLNNRYHDGTQDTYDVNGVRTPSPTGRKQWLVFKGIQGTINIQQIALDGEDVVYGSTVQAAIKLGFTPTKPIEIRNFGFKSLSIETDTCTEANANCSVGVTNVPGYLTPATVYGGAGFDANNEKGFLGLNVNTNLSLTGSIKIFSCSSGHPRC